MRVIGLMSGTSYDAVEAAAADLELRGEALEMRPLGHRRDGSRCACPNRPAGRPGCSASPAGPRPERRPGQGRARTRDEPPARMPSAAASVRSVSVTMVSKAVSGATR